MTGKDFFDQFIAPSADNPYQRLAQADVQKLSAPADWDPWS